MKIDEKILSEYIIEIICDLDDQNNLKRYNNPGVWALYAKKDDKWRCVQVAKTKNVAKEIKVDIKRLNLKKFESVGKHYINQFGEYCFQLDEYQSDKYQLYQNIRKKYDQFVFVHLSVPNEKRSKIESDFAWITKSEFWRNGGKFKKENLDQYKDYYSKVCMKIGITTNIQSDIQHKIETKIKEFYANANKR